MKQSVPRILVVDDDKNILETLRVALEANGYVVDTALNGQEAIQKSEATFFNLALLDIKLPDMKGTELLTKLEDATPRMRKVVITGYPSFQNAVDALNKNADAYLMKPVDMEKLLNIVRVQLEMQAEDRKYSEAKVTEFIETRVKEIAEA